MLLLKRRLKVFYKLSARHSGLHGAKKHEKRDTFEAQQAKSAEFKQGNHGIQEF